MVDFVICAKCGEREYASGEHVCPREPLTLDETEKRLIKAWRRYGSSLGRLLAHAAQDAHVLPGDFIDRTSDETMMMMLEAAALRYGQKGGL